MGVDRRRRRGRGPRRRAGPRAPHGWCRIAWRGGRPTGRGWFPRGAHWRARGGRADAAGPGGRDRRSGGHHRVRPAHPARGVAGVRPPRRPGRRRRPHPGGVPAGAPGAGRRSAASRRRAPGSCRSPATCAPTTSAAAPAAGRCSTGSCSARRPAAASAAERTGELDLDDLIGAPRPGSARSLRAHAGRGALVRRGGDGVRGADRHDPVPRRRAPVRTCSTASSTSESADSGVVGASSSASWTWPLVPTPLPPSIPSLAGEVGEPPAGLGEDHRHRADVVGLDDRVDHRRDPAGGDQRVAVAVAPGAQHRTGAVERGDRARPASG